MYYPECFPNQYGVYFLYFHPTSSSYSEKPFLEQNSLIGKSNQNTIQKFSDDALIVLTKGDLEKESYQQTKKPWTPAEDKLLLSLCKDQNARFQEIALKIEGRNPKMCYSRFRRLAHLSKIGWSKNENEKLIKLVDQYGENWKIIASLFKDKTHKQVKEHYINYLKPDLIKSQWTIQEDMELIRLINKHGKNWKLIEDEFIGRSRCQIKNRYFGKITRMNRKKMEEMGLPIQH